MAKVRVYELAKKLGVPSADLVEELRALGLDVSSHASSVDEEEVAKLKKAKKAPEAKTAAAPAPKPVAAAKPVVKQASPPPPPPKPAVKPAPPSPPPAKPMQAAASALKAAMRKEESAPLGLGGATHRPKTVVVAPPTVITGAEAQKSAVLMPPPPKPPVIVPVKASAAAKAEPAAKAAAKKPAAAKAPARKKKTEEEAPAPIPGEAETEPAVPEAAATVVPEAAPPAPPVHAAVAQAEAQVPEAAPAPEPPPVKPAAQAPQEPQPVKPEPPRPAAPQLPPGPMRPPQAPQRPPLQGSARPSYPARPGQPGPARPVQPAAPRPGAPYVRPSGPFPQRPQAPQQPRSPLDRRPTGPAPARPPVQGQPSAAPAVRPPEPARPPAPPSRLAPAPEVRRKTKRERRIEKLQARVDRRERIEQEIQEAQAKAETGEAVFIREGISVKELADKLNVKVKDIIAKLMMRGILVTINQPLDKDVAIQVASMFGFAAEIISFEDELVLEQEEIPEEQKFPRAPVVTVMGHVDHGKSSLLEAIHDVDITSKEHGGITQHIGAYRVRHKEREYVFLDTPGHEAFTLMRARGAQVTDVVILVVAADDGVMPQTVEAINHCKAANVPMVVAINKMDKPGADPMRVKRDLMQHQILTEEFGGETVCVPISAKTRVGIEDLLEMIAIVSDMLQLEASPGQLASGTVLESKLDKARGSVATVLIQDGSLKVGDLFLCGSTFGHVRGLFDDKGERVDHAGPSTPVEILGFSEVPAVGALFQGMSDEAKARQIASFRKEQDKARQLRTGRVRLENVFGAIQQGEIQELPLILKADVHGSLEAIVQQVKDLSTDEIKVNVVHQGVGAVSESDVLLASASNALIIGFSVRPERKAVELAKNEGVEIHSFTVIYDLIDRLKQALTGMLKPIEQEVILGHADVKEIFKVSKVGTVAGCIVADGRIPRTAQMRVLRDNVVVYTGRLGSLKRFKDDASEVKEGTECGIGIENYNDVKPGDVLEAFEIQVQERTLGDK